MQRHTCSTTVMIGLALVLVSACATAHGPSRIADPLRADALSDWSRVKHLSDAALIAVSTMDGRVIDGELVSVTDTAVVLRTPGAAVSPHQRLSRAAILEIRGPVMIRGSIPGAILGGWLGFAVGALPGLGGAPAPVGWLALAGSIGAGSFLGYHFSGHAVAGIVYRAAN